MESARWLSRLRWWRTCPPLLKGAAALAVVCVLAFALGQGAAILHASRLAAQTKRPMSAPLAAEQVSAAKGILPSIVNLGPAASAAPPTQVAFTTAQPSAAGAEQRPQTDQAPLKHKGKGDEKHGAAHMSDSQDNGGSSDHGGPHGGPHGDAHSASHSNGKPGAD